MHGRYLSVRTQSAGYVREAAGKADGRAPAHKRAIHVTIILMSCVLALRPYVLVRSRTPAGN
jgi:hypothetical protein